MDAVRHYAAARFVDGQPSPVREAVAVERALEVRLHGNPFAVIMRTPGRDVDLALGFLFSEGVITRHEDVISVSVSADQAAVDVSLIAALDGTVEAALGSRRQVTMNASCGMCGRRELASLHRDAPVLAARWQVSADLVASLPDRLRAAQVGFDETGGLHAAGVFTRDGRLQASAEDVGRHNAVDKVIGALLAARALPFDDVLLCVSGRLSFELVQKAYLAGIPLLAGVSAPSSLAVELATDAGMTLAAFVREGRCTVYTGAERIISSDAASVSRLGA